jgi:dolichyl-phosphate-mannose-protein mannosyltransferase
MSQAISNRGVWLALVFAAALPRVLGAFFLPNAFGDAYVYIRDIGVMTTKIKTGTFAPADLYGFWLPLYQFISALLNVFIGNGFYTGKLVSALFGVGVCLLVYAVTVQLVAHRTAALLAFALIAFNPLHILNSASAMTDVPHAFFVLASLYFVLKGRWVAAAIFAALAGLTRVDSWMLLALIPLIQVVRERRVSIPGILIMLIPPVFWFYVSWKATGDWLACFRTRQQYHDWLLTQNPALAHFSFSGVLKDGAMLLTGTDVAVLLATFAAGWIVLRKFTVKPGKEEPENSRLFAPLIFFFAYLGLLVIAYLTHQQPIIFPRYSLILFSLGIPILAWTYFEMIKRRPEWSRKLLVSIILLCVLNIGIQSTAAVGELNRYSVQRAVADYLRDHFDSKSNTRIFCDDGTVQVLTGIPAEKFVTSAEAPKDRQQFLSFLDRENVEYLVVIDDQNSTPYRVIPELGSDYGGLFELVAHSSARFLRSNIRLYHLRQKRGSSPTLSADMSLLKA